MSWETKYCRFKFRDSWECHVSINYILCQYLDYRDLKQNYHGCQRFSFGVMTLIETNEYCAGFSLNITIIEFLIATVLGQPSKKKIVSTDSCVVFDIMLQSFFSMD